MKKYLKKERGNEYLLLTTNCFSLVPPNYVWHRQNDAQQNKSAVKLNGRWTGLPQHTLSFTVPWEGTLFLRLQRRVFSFGWKQPKNWSWFSPQRISNESKHKQGAPCFVFSRTNLWWFAAGFWSFWCTCSIFGTIRTSPFGDNTHKGQFNSQKNGGLSTTAGLTQITEYPLHHHWLPLLTKTNSTVEGGVSSGGKKNALFLTTTLLTIPSGQWLGFGQWWGEREWGGGPEFLGGGFLGLGSQGPIQEVQQSPRT